MPLLMVTYWVFKKLNYFSLISLYCQYNFVLLYSEYPVFEGTIDQK